MEGMQEHTVTPRAARNTGQRGIKQEGGVLEAREAMPP